MTPKNHSKEKEESYLGVAKTEGFALVIALSLMAFVLLLLLSISTLVRVEVGAADRNRVQLQARQSALLGLQIAVGELQSFAGPDQRITATANIAAGADGASIVAGVSPENNTSLDGTPKGLSAVVPGTRYWTGVFKNRDDPEEIYQKTPSVSLQRWLVSGHNNQTTLPTPADNSYSVGADGKVGDPSIAILLAGPNSLGEGADAADRYVAAPRVLVADASATNASSTAFAYWVGDEGVKARINMAQVNTDSDYASLVAQRRGWETVAGFTDYPLPGADGQLAKVFNLPELAVTVSSLGQGSPSTPLESVFHSATPYSRGLLVNTLEGGTQIDLTALLAGTLPDLNSTPADRFANYPISGGRVVESSAFPNLQHLTWDHLQDFYQTATNFNGGTLTVQAAGSKSNTIAPTITDLRFLFGADVNVTDPMPDPANPEKFYANVVLAAKIAVTLANPYSVPIEWKQPIEVEILNNTPDGLQPLTVYWRIAGKYANNNSPMNVPSGSHFLPQATSNTVRNGNDPAVLNKAIFKIPAGKLDPGEAVAYSHLNQQVRPKSNANQVITVDLAKIDLATLGDFSNYLGMDIGESMGNHSKLKSDELSTKGLKDWPNTKMFPRDFEFKAQYHTSRINLEMRLAGSTTLLRRISDLELNNPYRVNLQQRFDKVFTLPLTGPVPLLLYRFQMSQPGVDYTDLMLTSSDMGQLGSTLRTYSDFNVRSTNFHSPITSYNTTPYFLDIINSPSALKFDSNALPGLYVGGTTGDAFRENLLSSPLYWGYSQKEGTQQVVLYSLPSQFVSLAQFQHADLTQDAVTRSIAHQPGNAFGNSYATPFVQRDLLLQDRTDYDLKKTDAFEISRTYYDISYILNSAIWDRYFFSSLLSGETEPENSSMLPLPEVAQPALNDANLAATGLVVDGAFNINSTEKEAWKAFLGSSKHFRHPADSSDEVTAAFPRSLKQPESFANAPSGSEADSYAGYRRLRDPELDTLAEAMVQQVRLRGPFVSRSHFINRTLVSITSSESEWGYSGPLQTALDESGINISIDGNDSLNKFSPKISSKFERVKLRKNSSDYPTADWNGTATSIRPDDAHAGVKDWAQSAFNKSPNFSSISSIVADREMLADEDSVVLNGIPLQQGYRSTGIPGWVTQADVLQVIGPAISARSDTFRIRTAGQSLDLSGDVQGTAYLEAVVQRMPEYVDPSNAANERDTANTTNLTQTNQNYGRKFEIISVRWLSPDEI